MKTIKDHYPAIDKLIDRVYSALPDQDRRLADIFKNCISDTLQRTIEFLDDDSVFMLTGDIPAMWLRDSACQLMPFLHVAGRSPRSVTFFLALSAASVPPS